MDVLEEALRRRAAEREAYVRAECGADEDLYREVLEAAQWEERMGEFLREPFISFAAAARPFEPGQVIADRFEILREIGEGGMGVVYEAFDGKRKQRIALKAAKPGFQRLLSPELEAALQVRHHNICLVNQIHSAETPGGEVDFLTMELLEGQTLSAHIAEEGSLAPEEALDIALQLCAGVAEAHRSGVLHRDLKSANVFLCKEENGGLRTVITDFGLASPLSLPSGESGGTPGYMAPELWNGEKASEASDIYALGVILYEMVTGVLPYCAQPSTDEAPPDAKIISVPSRSKLDGTELRAQTILPPPPSARIKKLDPRWDKVIMGCLALAPAERTQTVAEVQYELKKKRVPMTPFVVAALLLLMVAAAAALWWWRRPLAQYAFDKYQITQLTNDGGVSLAAISPDGKYLAYTGDESGKQNLLVQHLGATSTIRLLGPVSGLRPGLRFTPDSNYIYFSQSDTDDPGRNLSRIPVLGGPPEKQTADVFHDVFYQVGFSPDGKQIVLARRTRNENTLVIANTDGTNERTLLTFAPAEVVAMPAWSPSGNRIAFLMDEKGMGAFNCLAVVSVSGGKEQRILHDLFSMFGVAWLPDESGLVITAPPQRTQPAIWIVSYPKGTLRKITNDLAEYFGVSTALAGKRIVSVQRLMDSSLWVAPADNPSQVTQLREGSGRKDGMMGVAWLPDGAIVYASQEGEVNNQLWRVGRDGHDRRRLSTGPNADMHPSAASTGGKVVFARVDSVSNVWDIWETNTDGTDARRLTSGTAMELGPEISPDAKWITYATIEGPYKMVLATGNISKLAPSGEYPAISPDGKWIAFVSSNDRNKDQIQILAADENATPRFLPLTQESQVPISTNLASPPIHWTADGKFITYVRTRDGVSNIWAQPIDGSPARQLTSFNSMYIWRHAWSPDGKYLVMARGNFSRDAVMLTDAR